MPRIVVTYKVFLASPGDVKEERGIVKKVIETYNQIHSCDNIKLELQCWEIVHIRHLVIILKM